MKRRRVQPVQQIKYLSLMIAALAAGIGWFNDQLLPIDYLLPLQPYEGLFRTVAVWLFALSGIFQFLVQRHYLLVDAYLDRLTDIESCAAQLARRLHYQVHSPVTFEDIYGGYFPAGSLVAQVVSSVIAGPLPLGSADRKRLLVLKAVEHGLLEETKTNSAKQGWARSFRLTFSPEDFRPLERPPPPPMTRDEALRLALIASPIFTLLTGLAAYAFSRGASWGTLPTILAFPVLAVLIVAVRGWIAARRSASTSTGD
jgi:hypothetical protein